MEETISFEGKNYSCLRFNLGNLPLLIVKARKGYVACAYIDKNMAEKLGDVACFVSGVKNFDDLFKAKIKSVTAWAEELGIREGMSAKKALELMDAEDKK